MRESAPLVILASDKVSISIPLRVLLKLPYPSNRSLKPWEDNVSA